MTYGPGMSDNAARLAALIDQDSGYGGSMDGESISRGWNPDMTEDRYTPVSTPSRSGESNATSEQACTSWT